MTAETASFQQRQYLGVEFLGGERDRTRFSALARAYWRALGFGPHECASEDEARASAGELIASKRWPVYFFPSDTTGEKDFEEFYTDAETLDMDRFENIGVIKNSPEYDQGKLEHFLSTIDRIRSQSTWDKPELVELFNHMIPEFQHKETGKYLDGRM